MTAICRPAPVGPPQAPEGNPLPEARNALLFDAELTPHRSLPPRGFLLLMAGVSAISFGAGLLFFLMGAWPVIGFLGADVLLIFLAFKINYRRGRLAEHLQLTAGDLTVTRVWPGGRSKSWQFQTAWLQILLDDPPKHDSPLVLRSHGRSLTIGSFLTKEERADLARALRSALAEAR
ncbi:DUF2244 domain-containing protein [Pelagibius litoralis]|uniref:DUF2244 domain-containing protein n=1 Tax=Pelagibius litoralis TaxID=374515 RepID=A0A967KGB2_9PROT|nr:DUF2244 domain-containing protein [Pelagibius litoralis]NIA71985.1 DUF2244 domain-containing protein [Pelagibius litoralis]